MEKKLSVLLFAMILPFVAESVLANDYTWKGAHFQYGNDWELVTNKTVDGMRMVHLEYRSKDKYPLSLVFSIIPKLKKKSVDLSKVSPHVAAVNYALPFLKHYGQVKNANNMLITFNSVPVANQQASGALALVPTPKKNVYISAQSFFVSSEKYYVLGLVITRVDKGLIRLSKDYSKHINEAYKLLDGIRFK